MKRTIISYVMRKKDNKYIIKRYVFINDQLVEVFWVNTYSDLKDTEWIFKNIYDYAPIRNWKIIKDIKGKNIRELSYEI